VPARKLAPISITEDEWGMKKNIYSLSELECNIFESVKMNRGGLSKIKVNNCTYYVSLNIDIEKVLKDYVDSSILIIMGEEYVLANEMVLKIQRYFSHIYQAHFYNYTGILLSKPSLMDYTSISGYQHKYLEEIFSNPAYLNSFCLSTQSAESEI
jgi:hypothetical protein